LQIILFDIDGTLLAKQSTEGDERERFRRAVLEVVGKSPATEPWKYDGMVDPEICRLLLTKVGLSPTATAEHLQQVLTQVGEIYLAMEKKPILNKGVANLLPILKTSSDHRLGVLTGNLASVAEEKLRITGIRSHFSEVFYSDGYFNREDLVRAAVGQCIGKYQLRDPKSVTIVGDTPRDIEAANANNVEALGAATGFYSAEQLAEAGATAVFSSLEPSKGLLEALHMKKDWTLGFLSA